MQIENEFFTEQRKSMSIFYSIRETIISIIGNRKQLHLCNSLRLKATSEVSKKKKKHSDIEKATCFRLLRRSSLKQVVVLFIINSICLLAFMF